MARPTLIGSSFEEIIEPSLEALQGRPLGLSDAELKQLVLAHPAALDGSPPGEESKVQWISLAALQKRLSLSDAELKQLVLALPALLSRSYETEVQPLLAGLEKTWGLKKPADLKKFVLKMPSALGIVYEVCVCVCVYPADLLMETRSWVGFWRSDELHAPNRGTRHCVPPCSTVLSALDFTPPLVL